jgi:hypothetical protein
MLLDSRGKIAVSVFVLWLDSAFIVVTSPKSGEP